MRRCPRDGASSAARRDIPSTAAQHAANSAANQAAPMNALRDERSLAIPDFAGERRHSSVARPPARNALPPADERLGGNLSGQDGRMNRSRMLAKRHRPQRL